MVEAILQQDFGLSAVQAAQKSFTVGVNGSSLLSAVQAAQNVARIAMPVAFTLSAVQAAQNIVVKPLSKCYNHPMAFIPQAFPWDESHIYLVRKIIWYNGKDAL